MIDNFLGSDATPNLAVSGIDRELEGKGLSEECNQLRVNRRCGSV